MKQHQKLAFVLCLTWTVTLLYGEMFSFWIPTVWSCSWPSTSLMNGAGGYGKVAVIADPQVMDKTSLPLPPKSLALEIVQFFTDLYMRRAFFGSILPFKPDVILFLGDHFDGGPYLSDEEWQESLSRFKHIFGLKNKERFRDIQVYYLVGNHDVGYAALLSHKPEIVGRYEKEFGKRNFRFTIGKVEFISVDAQTLDGHPEGNQASATWDFVKNVSVDFQSLPRVLLTHIPLYRRDGTPCGPHRSSPIINQRIVRAANSREIMYQNYITEESSNRLLDLIKPKSENKMPATGLLLSLRDIVKPMYHLCVTDTASVNSPLMKRVLQVLILSGHDHDQCTVSHESNQETIKEHTVGTISWQQGNLYPSFMLLSASNSAPSNASNMDQAVVSDLCFLPMQTHIYMGYLSLFIVTLLAAFFWPTGGVNFGYHYSDVLASVKQHLNGGTKEKDEDENCDYEMVWDAEGSMHLVRKALSTPISSSNDRSGTAERGNAVMRPTAKKSISQEVEISMNVDDPAASLAPRTSKSATKFIIHRLVRTFRTLTVIAVVNVPLYMMLLFKDWIDQ